MAALLLKEISSDFLECQICLQSFRTPKILPCLHTFCKECLAEYTKAHSVDGDQIKCPTCRSKSPLPGGTIDGLKDNFFVESLKDTVNLHKTLHSEDHYIVCSNPYCDSKGLATSRCLNCDELLCGECVAAHLRIKVTRDHTVLGLDELRGEGQALSVRQGEGHTCGEHPDEVIKFFCETCQVPMCRDCALLKHRDHSFTHLKDHSSSVRAKLQDKIVQIKTKADELQAIRSQLWNQLEEEKQAEENINLKIIDTASRLKETVISEIDGQKESLLAKNRKIAAQRQKFLSSEEDGVGTSLVHYTSAVDFAEKLVSYGSDYEVTVVGSETEERLSVLGEEQGSSPEQLPPLVFDPSTQVPALHVGSVRGDIKVCEGTLSCGHTCGVKHLHLRSRCEEIRNEKGCSRGHQIFIRRESDCEGPRTITMDDVRLDETVASLKAKYCRKIDADVQTSLVFAGKTLRDELTLGSYGIGFNSTLFLQRTGKLPGIKANKKGVN
ncbi:E3 ubiquitin-protein ligase TRIM56-like [Branchiostoma lanceolatum]|uniref:E3 ubiquitin-protein ligase TRIM56-like n=1 Tax=Branchiostoma lanceolatum TaxID=7740 RepID=UPI00345356D2